MSGDDEQRSSNGLARSSNGAKPAPSSDRAGAVTQILSAIDQGDEQAADRLFSLVYDELRKLAAVKMAEERPGQTMQATALVHEAYLRLVVIDQPQNWSGRGHFYAAAVEAMRRILIESARRKSRQKHGGGRQRLDLDDVEVASAAPALSHADLLALDEALTSLSQSEPLKARLVQLRLYTGLSNDEAAAILGISAPTAKRYWRYARAWLHAELNPDSDAG